MLSPRRVFWRAFLSIYALLLAPVFLLVALQRAPAPLAKLIGPALAVPIALLFGVPGSIAPGWFGGNVIVQPLGIAGWLWLFTFWTLCAVAIAGLLAGIRAVGWRVAASNRKRSA